MAEDSPASGEFAFQDGQRPLTVLVVTANRAFAERLRRTLGESAGLALSIVGAPSEATFIGRLAVEHQANVIAIDAHLIEDGWVSPQLLSEELEAEPEVLLLFDEVGESAVHLSLLAHAHGCLQFDVNAEVFAHAVDAVVNGGELWFPRWMMEPFYDMALSAAAHGTEPREGSAAGNIADVDLTEREVEVMQLVRRGLTNKEVARRLGISPSTVKKHLHNALVKHGILRRRQLYR